MEVKQAIKLWKSKDGFSPIEIHMIVESLIKYVEDSQAAQQSVQPTGGKSAPLQALSTPEVLSIGGADSTPPTIG